MVLLDNRQVFLLHFYASFLLLFFLLAFGAYVHVFQFPGSVEFVHLTTFTTFAEEEHGGRPILTFVFLVGVEAYLLMNAVIA